MQQAQQQKPTTRPRPKRTVGELVAAWLILLWGAVTTIYFFPASRVEMDLESRMLTLLSIGQGLTCFLGGVAALLRLRKGAQALLTLSGLCFLSLIGIFLWFGKKYDVPALYLVPLLICALLGLVSLALGRWFGRLEDVGVGDLP